MQLLACAKWHIIVMDAVTSAPALCRRRRSRHTAGSARQHRSGPGRRQQPQQQWQQQKAASSSGLWGPLLTLRTAVNPVLVWQQQNCSSCTMMRPLRRQLAAPQLHPADASQRMAGCYVH
jgi:hypothetical protein